MAGQAPFPIVMAAAFALGILPLAAEAPKAKDNVLVVDTIGAFYPSLNFAHYLLSAEFQRALSEYVGIDGSIGLYMDLGEHGPTFMPQGGIGLRWMFEGRGLPGFYARLGVATPKDFAYCWMEASLGWEFLHETGFTVDNRISAVVWNVAYLGLRIDLVRMGWTF
jgi:hypothetical protein